MMFKRLLSILVLSILVAPILVGCGEGELTSSLIIFRINGDEVSIMKAGTDSWTGAQVGMPLEVGDTVKSGDNANAVITCFDGTTIELQAGTEIEIEALSITETGPAIIVPKQTIGSIIFRVTKIIDPGSRYEVQTPTGAVAVRGSAMRVSVIEDGTTWACNLEGDIWAIAQGVELQVPQGMCCVIRPGQSPELIMQTSESDKASTPTTGDYVLASSSTITDSAIGNDGEVTYAIVETVEASARLLKSDDSAATWGDITDALEQVDDVNYINPDGGLLRVETDGADANFVAVAVWENSEVRVYFSNDGGATFNDAGEVEDGSAYLNTVADLAVSRETAGNRTIAIGGMDNVDTAGLFRCMVTGDSTSAWDDATAYDGWDDEAAFASCLVTDIIFSSNWASDKTILAMTIAYGATYYDVYLQCGSWGTTPSWNEWSDLGIAAVPMLEDVDIPMWLADWDARTIAGITLPSDYSGVSSATRVLWVWVDYYDSATGYPACNIILVDDDNSYPLARQVEAGQVWLTNVSYLGTIAGEGKAIAGVLGTGWYDPNYGSPEDLLTGCCEGVQVYRNDNIYSMDICCFNWEATCKPPTGRMFMEVSLVSEDKAYAVALQGSDLYDEGAWSVTFDYGDTWNQLSLTDTYVDYFSGIVVSPDGNKTMLVSVNEESGCGCDSIWLRANSLLEAPEYSGYWLRVWCGALMGYSTEWDGEAGFVELPADETAGDTAFLVDIGSQYVYLNDLEPLACWTPVAPSTLNEIVDAAAPSADTLYALDFDGNISIYDHEGWHESVASDVDYGWTIAVWGNHVLVGGQNGDVSYSDDGGATFTALEDIATSGSVIVAFDNYFDANNTVYAALGDAGESNGVYRWVIDESTKWENLCRPTH